MNKFTIGEWIFNRNQVEMGEKHTDIISASESELYEPIARIPHDDITGEGVIELTANMHLIAAAPEMYEALVAAMKFIDVHPADPDITAEQRQAYAALMEIDPRDVLRKARGEA